MSAHRARAPIAISIGDPNGVGPEVAVKAAARLAAEGGPPVVLVGDRFVVDHYAGRAGAATARFGAKAPTSPVAVLDIPGLAPADFRPGTVSAAAGAATVAYCAAAVALAREGTAAAVIGCPHSETAVNASGTPFTGYPGLIARLTGTPEDRVFLMLVGAGLRIVHVTLHERLADALARLTPQLVEAAGLAAVEALQALGLSAPRIGVFGVNPHASEDGLFGPEDAAITAPAAQALRAAGVDVEGPVGADLLLGRRDLDAYLAMYHDQGHIPIKLLAGRTASALTIGAGVLFSSVGHGAAFDIAGRDQADPEAVLRTVRLLSSTPSPAAAAAVQA
jgi:4-hydroxythreonine-4-phosphate dehydrogenase